MAAYGVRQGSPKIKGERIQDTEGSLQVALTVEGYWLRHLCYPDGPCTGRSTSVVDILPFYDAAQFQAQNMCFSVILEVTPPPVANCAPSR